MEEINIGSLLTFLQDKDCSSFKGNFYVFLDRYEIDEWFDFMKYAYYVDDESLIDIEFCNGQFGIPLNELIEWYEIDKDELLKELKIKQ